MAAVVVGAAALAAVAAALVAVAGSVGVGRSAGIPAASLPVAGPPALPGDSAAVLAAADNSVAGHDRVPGRGHHPADDLVAGHLLVGFLVAVLDPVPGQDLLPVDDRGLARLALGLGRLPVDDLEPELEPPIAPAREPIPEADVPLAVN